MADNENTRAPAGDAQHAAWLADKIVALGDYAKEAAEMLRRWPSTPVGANAPEPLTDEKPRQPTAEELDGWDDLTTAYMAGFYDGKKGRVALATPTDVAADESAQIVAVYDKLHEGKLGAHWLWVVLEQIAAGESEEAALRAYGWVSRADESTRAAPVQALLNIAAGKDVQENYRAVRAFIEEALSAPPSGESTSTPAQEGSQQ